MSEKPITKGRSMTFWLRSAEYEQLNATVARTGLTGSNYLRLLVTDALNQDIEVARLFKMFLGYSTPVQQPPRNQDRVRK